MLVDRAQARAPDFALTDENCGAAADTPPPEDPLPLAEQVMDGMPLAIELAAVRLASLSASDLLDRLDDRFSS